MQAASPSGAGRLPSGVCKNESLIHLFIQQVFLPCLLRGRRSAQPGEEQGRARQPSPSWHSRPGEGQTGSPMAHAGTRAPQGKELVRWVPHRVPHSVIGTQGGSRACRPDPPRTCFAGTQPRSFLHVLCLVALAPQGQN